MHEIEEGILKSHEVVQANLDLRDEEKSPKTRLAFSKGQQVRLSYLISS